MTEHPSGRLYTAVTKYWPRIAAGLVATVGMAAWIIEGLTADTGLEFYLMAWGATTAGLWFLFEKAEKALSEDSRAKVVGWLKQTDVESGFASIPAQFGFLFDRIFGAKHLAWKCFLRSSLASLLVVLVLFLTSVGRASGFQDLLDNPETLWWLFLWATIMNAVPDYLSLLETRLLLRHMVKTNWLSLGLLVDLLITGGISFVAVAVGAGYVIPFGDSFGLPGGGGGLSWFSLWSLLTFSPMFGESGAIFGFGPSIPFGMFFYSAFFTSVWLWIYAGSVMLSRILLRMNNGVGFLLRVTDVENQPFRSMGFVSVIIVSGLFALGLPLVFL